MKARDHMEGMDAMCETDPSAAGARYVCNYRFKSCNVSFFALSDSLSHVFLTILKPLMCQVP